VIVEKEGVHVLGGAFSTRAWASSALAVTPRATSTQFARTDWLAPIEGDCHDAAHMPLAIRISGSREGSRSFRWRRPLDVTEVHVLVVTAEVAASFGQVQKIVRDKHSSRVLETAQYKARTCR
jgi:hypothetical protein